MTGSKPNPTNEELRELLMPLIEQEIIESEFLDEHDKNVGGTLYTQANNQKLTASAIADWLSVKLQPAIAAYTAEQVRLASGKLWNWLLFCEGYFTDLTALKITRSRNKAGERTVTITIPYDKEHMFSATLTPQSDTKGGSDE